MLDDLNKKELIQLVGNICKNAKDTLTDKILYKRIFFWGCIGVFAFLLFGFNTPYLEWDYSHTEYAVLGVICHAFVWMFVRFFPFVLIALVVGIVLTRKKK